MKGINIDNLVRENIKSLKPYSSARSEYTGDNAIFLDANENPNNFPYNRYPDPLQWQLKHKISEIKGVDPKMIFFGNGSDEAIDLVIRIFCSPGIDNIVSIDPTYGMYQVCADINGVDYREVLLTNDFQIDTDKLLKKVSDKTKLIFLCSPNNPTSNSFYRDDILFILNNFNGLVIVDEAYIDFSSNESFVPELRNYQNLIILQTLSKAWGLAGIRLGMCFADENIISLMNKVKYPYNVNSLTLKVANDSLAQSDTKKIWVKEILSERERLNTSLIKFNCVEKIYPSDANFLLVKVSNPRDLYTYLTQKKVIVRDRSSVRLCDGCLRFTVGSKEENNLLLESIKEYDS